MSRNHVFLKIGRWERAGAAAAPRTQSAADEQSYGTEGVGSFMAIAMPVWPVLALQGAPRADAATGWQIQQQAFLQALAQARALLSAPRHERLIAASWN